VNCTVRARNAIGYGPPSAPMSVTPSLRTFTGPSATGTGMITASFTGGGAGCTFAPTPAFIDVEGDPGSPPTGSAPAGVTFPHGLFDFRLTGCDATPVTMTITYPAVLGLGRIYKWGPLKGWRTYAGSIAGAAITYTLQDGGAGDDDGTVNGTIVDPVGVGAIIGAPNPVPAMSEWMLALMALLLAAAATIALRSRARGGRASP